jgi:hypothetical protein
MFYGDSEFSHLFTQQSYSIAPFVTHSTYPITLTYFPLLSHKPHDFRKRNNTVWKEICVLIFSTTFIPNFFSTIRIQWDTIVNLRKGSVILFDFNKTSIKDARSGWGSKRIATSGKAGYKWPNRPCSLERYEPSKCRELHIHRHSVTFQRTVTVLKKIPDLAKQNNLGRFSKHSQYKISWKSVRRKQSFST